MKFTVRLCAKQNAVQDSQVPNRILREGIIDSRTMNSMTEEAEFYYRRLISIVDDFGRVEADPEMLRVKCFPRRLEQWPVARLESAMAETSKCRTDDDLPLVSYYRVGPKSYLQVNNFGQRLRAEKSKYPPPGGHHVADIGPQSADIRPHSADIGPQFAASRAQAQSESNAESESESNAEAKSNKNHSSPAGAGEGETDAPTDLALEPDTAALPPKQTALVCTGWFEEFSGLFWRKDGRQKAQYAFNDRVKNPGVGRAGGKLYIAQTAEMLAREKQHRPHASTWLNQGRMFDEESPPQIRPVRTEDRNQRRRERKGWR